jgi:hypothetical protein
MANGEQTSGIMLEKTWDWRSGQTIFVPRNNRYALPKFAEFAGIGG